MGCRHVAGHGQAEAGAAAVPGPAFVEPDETLHDVSPVGLRDAGAVVVDVNAMTLASTATATRTCAAAAGGVVGEVVEGPPERLPVTADRTRRRRPPPRPARDGAAPPPRGRCRRSTASRANARSSPRASSNRSSTSPWSRSSSPSSTSPVACQSGCGRPPGDLELGAHHRDRRSQLVRRVRDEPAVGRRRRLEAAEHPVHRRASSAISSRRRRHGHPLVQRVGSDLGHPRRHAPHRTQRPPGEHPRQPGDERDERRADDHSRRGSSARSRAPRRAGTPSPASLPRRQRRHVVVAGVAGRCRAAAPAIGMPPA